MKYKFKKNQLFRKKLEVPERIVNRVYNNNLSFQDYIEYKLIDKVPISCLNEMHRIIVEKFGIERSKKIDWELIDLKGFELSETIEDIDETSDNINEELYRFVRTDMRPKDYTKMMRKTFSNYVLEDQDVSENIQNDFNNGYLKINEIVSIWDHVKDKDLSLCLKNDYHNKNNVTEEEVKKFMDEYSGLLSLLDDPEEIYSLITTIYRGKESKEVRRIYIKKIVDKILDKTIAHEDEKTISLTGEQFKIIFEYTSIKDYLFKKLSTERADLIIKQLDGKDPSYLLDISIPFNVLIQDDVMNFIEIYGLNNIINFDEECGNFFTKNDCDNLIKMNDLYIKYGSEEVDKEKSIFTKNPYGITGNYIERDYTKEEFYEAIRRMILYGPTNPNYKDISIDYRDIDGEFRELNPELFVDLKAPIEFQDSFYAKTLNPIFVRNHYNCISYLIGKKLNTIFTPLYVRITNKDDEYYYSYENVYKFLEEKLGFEETIKIITDYADVFDVMFSSYEKITEDAYVSPIQFSKKDELNDIINKINDKLYELITKAGIKYSSNLSKSMKEKYPAIFISYKAPKELHDKFYKREIGAKYIIENTEYRQYFDGLDIELFFDYMPIVLNTPSADNDKSKKIENLILFVKDLFGNEEGLSVLLDYHIYLDKINENLGFSKVEFQSNINQDDFLNQIDCLIYLNIIRGNILYDEHMPSHFKAAYPSLFLTDNTPDEIKNKFYNRLFSLDDFYSNPVLLKHFANTDIACCLDTTFSCMIGLFNSNDFLEIIRICGEEIKSDTKLFNYLRNKTSEMLTAKTMGELLLEYFNNSEQTLKYLILLEKFGVEDEHIKSLFSKFKRLIISRPDLDIYSPTMNAQIISDDIIDIYGYDTITSILESNTGAHKIVIDSINNNDKLLLDWINYIKKQPIYSKKILHLSILSYSSMKDLITDIVGNNKLLDDQQLINLKQILIDNNKYIVKNIDDLSNYDEFKTKILSDRFNSDNINVVRDSIFELLFNSSLEQINNLFDEFGLNSKYFMNNYLFDKEILSVEEEAIINIIKEVLDTDNCDTLRNKFDKIEDIQLIKDSLNSLKNTLKKYYSSQINNVLFNNDEIEKLNSNQVSGLDESGLIDINGNYIASQSKIDVINLEGEPFNILVYSLPQVYDKFENDYMKVFRDPSMWIELKNDILLMNLISNNHFGCKNHGDKNTVYYGFNNISENSLACMSRRDMVIMNSMNNLDDCCNKSEYMLPNILQSVSSSYNTIGIYSNSSDSSEFNHRIIPNYIVCFDGYINIESKKAAQYYNIPIFMINREKYTEQNDILINKYVDNDIDEFNKEKLYELFSIRNIDLIKRYEIGLSIIQNKYNEKEISKNNYIELLEELIKIINNYSIQNDVSEINLKDIEDILCEMRK